MTHQTPRSDPGLEQGRARGEDRALPRGGGRRTVRGRDPSDMGPTAKGPVLPVGWVPAIQFLSFDETGLPLGFLALRLSLNDKLFVEGGHIGYSIRPSQRRKGLAKLQLELGLAEARKQGLERVLITCDEDNEASRRTILSAGGVYENTINRSQRYWIELDGEVS